MSSASANAAGEDASCTNCAHNEGAVHDIEDLGNPMGKFMTADRRMTSRRVLAALAARKENTGLEGFMFSDPEVYKADLEHIFHKEWVFAGHDIEIPEVGQWLSLQVGDFPVVIVRGEDEKVHAYHNVCRHRGSKVVGGEGAGRTGMLSGGNLSCPYHKWQYDTNTGKLLYAREMSDDFDGDTHGLFPVHLECVSTYMFVCVADSAPDISRMSQIIATCAEPYRFEDAKVAYQSVTVEKGNWKLVWENNRECYHCEANHPELVKSFPADWVQSEDGDAGGEAAKKLQIPSDFITLNNNQFRIMRHLFTADDDGKVARSMTMDGKPIGNKRFGRMPAGDENVGNMPMYCYPSTWNHWQPDYALSFRVVPISPSETEVVTTYLVPKDAIEGKDYTIKGLTEVWEATNNQDRIIVERQQQGVSSPAFRPGFYNKTHESGVIEFVQWYHDLLGQRLSAELRRGASKM